mmetsp:Transcript_15196/g.27066  ORF Transcript_15196/g.27066 Transcript_15196/m.27066 type:complete len:216 (-) Transcript_15196:25-672(-)
MSGWLDEHWQAVRNVNVAVIAGSVALLAHITFSKRQVRCVRRQLRRVDFEGQRRLPVRVCGFERQNSLVYAKVIHTPSFVPRLWQQDAILWLRLYGLAAEGPDGPFLEDTPFLDLTKATKSEMELLYLEPPISGGTKDDSVVGNLLYDDLSKSAFQRLRQGRSTNLAFELIRWEGVMLRDFEPPGKYCTDSVEALRKLNDFHDRLRKSAPKGKQL